MEQNLSNNQNQFKQFLERKNIQISFKRYFIDAMGSMAFGLFASLLIGTIFNTIGDELQIPWLIEVANYAKSATGGAMGASIAYALQAPPLVLFSALSVGIAGNALGGPVGAFLASIVGVEFGKLVSKETKVDIIVTPSVCIISGVAVAGLVGPFVSAIMQNLGHLINVATELQPFLMGIVVSVVVGMVLTLPISSASLCIILDLSGLAAGAATAGCCAQMVGFAVSSFRENGMGGLMAQGLGTSMLQVPNIMKNPRVWLAPTLTASITGPLATVIFKMENVAVSAGMGTAGLVGPIGVLGAMGNSPTTWLSIFIVCILAPALLSFAFDKLFRQMGLVKEGDLKLDL